MSVLAAKASEGETYKEVVKEYQALLTKQDTIIKTVKEHRDKLTAMVKQYEQLIADKKAEIKKKNIIIESKIISILANGLSLSQNSFSEITLSFNSSIDIEK